MTDSVSQTQEFDTEEYWQERLSATYDVNGVGYAGLSRSYNQWLYSVRRYNFHRMVGRYELGGSPRVLDIGSGTGFYIDLWEEVGAESIVGIDIAEVAVKNLRKQYPDHTFLQEDISEPLPSDTEGRFDVISAMDVLFHIVDDESYRQALVQIYEFLRPGGYFVLTDNFLQSESEYSGHIVHRSLSNSRQALEEVGFEVKERTPVFVLMNEPVDSPPAWLSRLWSKIFRIASHSETTGNVLGAILFPAEIFLTRFLSESPTTEIMICRKPETARERNAEAEI